MIVYKPPQENAEISGIEYGGQICTPGGQIPLGPLLRGEEGVYSVGS